MAIQVKRYELLETIETLEKELALERAANRVLDGVIKTLHRHLHQYQELYPDDLIHGHKQSEEGN